jgi:alginate O-acetyltransferase complex protein AlgI
MLFNSLEFLIFFPVVAGLYFLLPQRARVPHLLAASCIFYMAFVPAYILILAITIVVDYAAGLWIARLQGRARRIVLVVSIVLTCLVLATFKYLQFLIDNALLAAGLLGWRLTGPSIDILLPVGLSFHTFQSLAYVIEVYRRRQAPERDFLVYSTYVMFFPQLVAGPIERPQNLLHQFREHHVYDHARVTSGLRRMAWGFFKKLVVADRLALYVNDVYADPQAHTGPQLALATLFFAFQIYCDFSGYSDIAVGSARVMGFRLMENFDRPYASRSIAEFWTRWHISLSHWFRDYVYIPLGGSRCGAWRHARNLMLTFALSGLWHGAAWTYVAWGLLNGLYLVAGQLAGRLRARWSLPAPPAVLAVGTTFALTCLAWIPFRAHSLGDAWHIVTHLHTGWGALLDISALPELLSSRQFLLRQLPVALAALVALELMQWPRLRQALRQARARAPLPARWSAYTAFVLGCVLLGVHRETQFIYFQF